MSERFDTFSPPPLKPDPRETSAEAAAADEEASLDPRAAAALLDRTKRRAERLLELRPTWLTLSAAVVVLVCYGVLWVSVRDQHPYRGPTGWALGVLYGTLAIWIVVNAVVFRRATSGVGGRAARQRAIIGPGVAVIWICVYIVQGALYHAGASRAIAYGIWPAAGPLIMVGSAAAAYEAGRERAASAGLAVAAVVLGSLACFAGPRAVWGVIAVGLCALLLAATAARLGQRRT
ncbi:MAG TPA: hypothetical protein VGN27_02965 [Gaiellaceae bacterium]|jgi:hypothetical protein|nr:hypothetical protein [Gaiellaceae bacterium]